MNLERDADGAVVWDYTDGELENEITIESYTKNPAHKAEADALAAAHGIPIDSITGIVFGAKQAIVHTLRIVDWNHES